MADKPTPPNANASVSVSASASNYIPTIDPSNKRRDGSNMRALPDEVILAVVDLFARGYSTRFIRAELTKALARVRTAPPSDQELMQLAVMYAADIDKYRVELAQITLRTSLARGEQRMNRLNQLAEQWEVAAMESPKAAAVYLRTMEQLRREGQDAGIRPMITEDDPWMKILSQLRPKQLPGTTEQSEG